jgi:hypothetical protein
VDDFLSKPLDVGELAHRLAAADRLLRALRIVERVSEGVRVRSSRPPAIAAAELGRHD